MAAKSVAALTSYTITEDIQLLVDLTHSDRECQGRPIQLLSISSILSYYISLSNLRQILAVGIISVTLVCGL
jgi:hypothetical protein